jgi:peptidoglycan-N-acetylglucosamine deacetylase
MPGPTPPRLALLAPLALLLGCAPRAVGGPAAAVEVAVTVDDLPVHGPLLDGQSRVGLARRFLQVFRAHRLPPVHGFVNGARLEAEPASEQVLTLWRGAGQRLGNHGWAHLGLDDTPLDEYRANITRNEPLLARLEPDATAWHFFRYPFLYEGRTLEARRAVRRFLAEQGYAIAEVSLDADDWAFSPPLARCAARGDAAAQAQLRADFVAVHLDELRRMRRLGQALEHRELRHVLLLHLGAADADALDELLTAFEREGVTWVSLERALADPFYAFDPDLASAAGAAFPYRVARARGVPVEPPIYARGLEERLEALCR